MRFAKIGPFALLCALLLTNAASFSCSLAAYSETRSFRDALDGRSMEEAISGPVDKDTSSYGDRTSNGNGGQPSSASSGSSTMLSIPANGNLQQQQQMEQPEPQQQEKSPANGGGELEREAGPIEPGMSSMDGQQQMMEQKSARQMKQQRGGQMMNAPRMSARQVMNSAGALGSARQQQMPEQQTTDSYGSSAKDGEPAKESGSSFGDDQSGAKNAASMSNGNGRQSDGYGGKQSNSAANYGGQQEEDSADQQQMMNGGEQLQQEKSYDGQRQPEMSMMQPAQGAAKGAKSAMYMKMNGNGYSTGTMNMNMNGNVNVNKNSMYMKPAAAPMTLSYRNGKKSTQGGGSMAENMIMSLANKAAYANQRQQQMSQRQVAPPMMMAALNGGSSANGNKIANQRSMADSPMYKSLALMAGGESGMARGGMRRANQRSAMERKMSPAMVNALLNKMIGARQQQGDLNGMAKPQALVMMSQPMKAEMLANMMISSQAAGGALAGMSAAKKDQYKKMMMAAIMQQATGSADYGSRNQGMMGQEPEQQHQQERQQMPASDAYGDSQQKMAGEGASEGVAQQDSQMQMPMAAISLMAMNGGNKQKSYGAEMNDGYEGRAMKKTMGNGTPMSMMQKPINGYGMDSGDMQQQRMQMGAAHVMAPASYGNGQMMPTMGAMMAMMMNNNKMASSYGASSAPMSTPVPAAMQAQTPIPASSMGTKGGMGQTTQMPRYESTTPSSYNQQDGMDQQQRQVYQMMSTMMPAAAMAARGMNMMSPMDGVRQAYPSSQEQQPMQDTKGRQRQQPEQQQMEDAGAKGGTDSEMARPMQAPDMSSYKNQQQKPEDEQQQQQDEYGNGAAPMGMAEPFAFDYKIEDDYGNNQYRKEESDKNGVVRGSYGFMDTSGRYRHVEYVADENGFRANIKSNEQGLSTEPASPSRAFISSGSSSADGSGFMELTQQQTGDMAAGQQQIEQGQQAAQLPVDQIQVQQQEQQMQSYASQTQMNENRAK